MEANLKFDEATGTAQLILTGSLRIQHSADLKQVLTDTMDKADTTLLDLEQVDGFDLSSIQLLYAFHLASKNANKTFRLQGKCPHSFREAVESAGLSWAGWLCFGKNGDPES